MTREEGEALDHYLTTPPWDCEEDGHKWKYLGQDEYDTSYYKCVVCGEESGQ